MSVSDLSDDGGAARGERVSPKRGVQQDNLSKSDRAQNIIEKSSKMYQLAQIDQNEDTCSGDMGERNQLSRPQQLDTHISTDGEVSSVGTATTDRHLQVWNRFFANAFSSLDNRSSSSSTSATPQTLQHQPQRSSTSSSKQKALRYWTSCIKKYCS